MIDPNKVAELTTEHEARVAAIKAAHAREVDQLRGQVDMLQELASRLENERRGWRARAMAATQILRLLVVEKPIAQAMLGLGGATAAEANAEVYRIEAELRERIDLLERDAWSGCSQIARDFVGAWTNGKLGGPAFADMKDLPQRWADAIAHWSERFNAALKRST